MSKIEVNEIDAQSGTTITVGSACKSVAVPGNVVKTNAVQASDAGNIISQSGTTITIGASGDTVSLASGASQSGFGRAGSVDWQTGSIKTSTFTAASGEGYFVDTSSGAVTANLPAGSAGAIVSFADYTRTFGTNALTVTPNGSEKIGGVAASMSVAVDGQALTLVYVDGTEGWINVQNAEDTETGISYIAATGGNSIVTCGNYKMHIFTGPGTFTVCSLGNGQPQFNKVDYLVIGGGASGGVRAPGNANGGGGAGGLRYGVAETVPGPAGPLNSCTQLTVTATGFPVTVGAGGGGVPPTPGGTTGNSGSTSTFSTITSAGGGGGREGTGNGGIPGGSGGGSGGGASGAQAGGSGNTPPVSPPQGQNGGAAGGTSPDAQAGGGGGAGGSGSSGTPSASGAGGTGVGFGPSIWGTSVGVPSGGNRFFAGGGGASDSPNPVVGQPGGTGGGGSGAGDPAGSSPTCAADAGTANTGGGGGGGGSGAGHPFDSGSGGSGLVIIRYKFQGS
jgi:hypothetical protein